MTQLELLVKEIMQNDILKVVFSIPFEKDSKYKRADIKLVKNNKKTVYFVERFTQKQAFHKQVTYEQLCDEICKMLTDEFKNAEIFTHENVYGIRISSKGKVLHNKRKNVTVLNVPSSLNRKKQYIIDSENMPPVFKDIGIATQDGKLVNSHYSKYKQICRFTEFINDVVENDKRDSYNIVDFGCGKSYLTFVVYHYFTHIMHKNVNIVGLDLKQDVIENCNSLAEKYGYKNLSFLCMDIKDYNPKVKPDMVIALHACDVATDYALYNAYLWQTDYIFSVPCCQHEFNQKVKSKSLSLLTDFGLIKERFCALATDALRAKMLEYCGYSEDVLEFIDIEHSPKNILIRAKRNEKITAAKRKQIKEAIERFDDEFGTDLSLERFVGANEEYIKKQDQEFKVVCGRASMLLKDALSVRQKVFGSELEFLSGAKSDELDKYATIINVYDNDKTVATSRMCHLSDNQVVIGKIAVLQEYRTKGLGKILLDRLEREAKDKNIKTMLVDAQVSAKGFYEKNGFDACKDVYTQENKKLVRMKKELHK